MEEKFRCHPSIIIEKLGGVTTFLMLLSISSLDDLMVMLNEGGLLVHTLIILGIFGILSFIIIYNIIIWSKTFINIEENTIIIQRNTITSKVNTYGIKNISNINLEQNIFERIVGTYKIKIDTDSLSTANDTDIEIVLSKDKAYEFKRNVLELMNSEKSKTIDNEDTVCDTELDFVDDENIEYDLVYSTNDVLKHCFYNLSLGAIIFNLVFIVFTIFISEKMEGLEGILSTLLLVFAMVINIVKLFLGNLFRYYKFSIKRLEDKLYISCGMFKKRKYTIPINRINAINIKQPVLSRIFKKYSVDIVTIGVGDDESEGSQILLSCNKEDFMKNMKILLPELSLGEEMVLQRQPKKSLVIKFVNFIICIITIEITLYFISMVYNEMSSGFVLYFSLASCLLGLLILYMSYITRGVYLSEDNLISSYGISSKTVSIMKYKKVQYINVRENPISRKLNLCKGEIYILASLGNETKTIGYYDKYLFEKLGEKMINKKTDNY